MLQLSAVPPSQSNVRNLCMLRIESTGTQRRPTERRNDIYDGIWQIWWGTRYVWFRGYVYGPAVPDLLHRGHCLDHSYGDVETTRYGLRYAWHARDVWHLSLIHISEPTRLGMSSYA